MPEQSRITLCPNCATGFRVTEAQLELAEGQVRCGSCLQVFRADQHWSSESQEDPPKPPAAVSDKQATPTTDTDASAAAPAADGVEFSDDFLALDGREPKPADSLAQTAAENEVEEDNEGWAKQILEEEEQSSRGPKNELLDAIMAEPTREDDESPDANESSEPEVDYAASEFQTTESWMTELLGDSSEDAGATLAAATPAAQELPQPLDEPDQDYIPEIFRDKKDLLAGIQAEPLEMHIGRHFQPWMRQVLVLLGIALATVLLSAQYAWHNSERLAHNPSYRGFFATFCATTGCRMPAAHDISRIKNSNLVVLKHPRAANALLLDTIITNYASFEQAFPWLHVAFSDLQGKLLASRTFAPREYLRGDLQGATMMPVRRPVHISLELADPGERAVNYKIELRSPQVESANPGG